MTLFNDPRVVEATTRALGEAEEHPHREHAENARSVLNAAVAALPREELIEKAAAALFDSKAEHGLRPPVSMWPPVDMDEADDYRSDARAVLAAIGLIPEHVTPEEGHDARD